MILICLYIPLLILLCIYIYIHTHTWVEMCCPSWGWLETVETWLAWTLEIEVWADRWGQGRQALKIWGIQPWTFRETMENNILKYLPFYPRYIPFYPSQITMELFMNIIKYHRESMVKNWRTIPFDEHHDRMGPQGPVCSFAFSWWTWL